MKLRDRRRFLLAGAALLVTPAWAQPYPAKPIRMIVPFPPGGLTDNLARQVSEHLRSSLQQPVIVENRPGAGGMVGAGQLAGAQADGYTLMLASMATLCISPVLFKKATFKPSDVAPVAMLGAASLVLVAKADFPGRSLRDLVATAKAQPGTLHYASPSNGTAHHLLVEMLKAREDLAMTHVPYQGSVQALTDLLAGRVDVMFLDVALAAPQAAAGKLKALAITGAKRSPLLPDVPAMTETYRDLDLQPWLSVVAPANTPSEAVQRLNAEINRWLVSPGVPEQLRKVGMEPGPMTAAQFTDVIRKEVPRWGELVKLSGASVD